MHELSSSLTVTFIAEHHAAGFHACLDAVARERRFLAQYEALPLEMIQRFVKDTVAQDAIQFVALDGEQVVGWADVVPSWAHALAHSGRLGMGLLPAYRGRGLGQRLAQACIEKTWRKGMTRIELEARADNDRAIALYQKLGFVHEGLKKQAMRFEDGFFDTVIMGLVKPST